MSSRNSFVATMLAKAGIGGSASTAAIVAAEAPPAVAADVPAPAPADPAPAAAVEGATSDDVTAAIRAAYQEGRAAERSRTSAVLADKGALANVQTAAFMLAHSDAEASVITAQLATLPQPAMLTAELITAPAAAQGLTVDLSETPASSVAPNGAASADRGEDDIWSEAFRANDQSGTITAGGVTLRKGC